MAPTLRAFVALELSREVRAVLAALLDRLSGLEAARAARIRWTAVANLHLTLKFLGRLEASRLPLVRERLLRVAARHGPLRLTVEGAGGFPDARTPQILWIGVGDATGALGRLAAEVEEQLAPLGFPTENRAFSPHLTLGRVAAPERAGAVASALAEVASGLHEELEEDGLVLFKSETLPGGAKHTPLFRVAFTGAGGGDGRD
ncbi:MAG: RNA 2',3'-cyclic phosphodiesterase [Myxococcales bacterium]